MPNYHVQYSRRANQDVAQFCEWLQRRSPRGAVRWLDALEQTLTRLGESPLSFGLADESDLFPEPIRQIFFRTRHGNTYRALYVVRDDTVTLVCIRGPGQRPVTPDELKS